MSDSPEINRAKLAALEGAAAALCEMCMYDRRFRRGDLRTGQHIVQVNPKKYRRCGAAKIAGLRAMWRNYCGESLDNARKLEPR